MLDDFKVMTERDEKYSIFGAYEIKPNETITLGIKGTSANII